MASARDQADLLLTQSLLNDPDISYLKELAVSDNPQVDLIAVHGLRIPINFTPWKDAQSFGAKTWIADHSGDAKLWLKDFLPHDIQGLRVLLFGYNSNVGWDVSTAGVSGAADDLLLKLKNKRAVNPERPILFVCHSLGGIVVKHAIAKARSNPKYEKLFKSVRGIAFFATPHRGGLAAKQGAAAAGALRHATRNPRSSIMEALRADSLISFDIHQYFLHSLTNIRICSFYEMKPMPGLSRLVVDKNSALLGLPYPQEDVMPVPESNHSTICKFDARTQNYELVISGIADMVGWALKEISVPDMSSTLSPPSLATSVTDDDSSSGLSAPYCNTQVSYAYLPDFGDVSFSSSEEPKSQIPFAGPIYLWPSLTFEQFTGRKGLMSLIQEALLINRSHQSRLALYGLGGVGKTQIALQLMQWYRTSYPNESIFWINGGSGDMLRQSLTEIALRCNLLRRGDAMTEPLDAVRRFLLNEDKGRWLMIVDNADNPNAFFKPSSASSSTSRDPDKSQRVALSTYIPICAHGRIVFTTNSKAFGERLSMQGFVIEIPPLGLPEACELLHKRLFEDMQLAESPPSYRREIPTKADLERLCGYLDCLPLALSQAAAFMRQQNVTVGEYIQLLDDDESRLSDLLEHNFQAYGLKDDFSKAIACTWNVTFDSILADSPIAAELLSFMAFLDSKNIPKFLLRYVESNEWNLTVIGLGTLQGYALVNLASKNETFSIHRLVQHAMRKRLASLDAATKWSRKALAILSEQFPDGEYASWETCATLIPHALHILKNDFSKYAEDMLLVAMLQSKISLYYSRMGLYSQAAEVSLKTLETFGRCPDAPKRLVYETKSLRAKALKNNDQLQEAEDLAKEVWYERQNELGAKHVDTLESSNTLALMYQEQGKFKESAKVARHTLKGLRKILDEDDLIIQATKRRLGTILQKLGDYPEAETLLREALDVYTDQLGPDDSVTLKAKWRLAWILHDQAKYKEAEQMSFETWTAQKRTIGENHPDSLKSLFLLADDLQAQSKFEAALKFKRNVYAQAVALVGPKHRHTLIAAASLASCLVASVSAKESFEAYEEASGLYNAVLKGREELLLPDHPETLSARTDVATVLRLRESLNEAETLERETLKKAKTVLERDHPIVLASRENLACILWAQKDSKAKLKEAVEQIKKVLKAREKRYGWSSSDTRGTANLVIEMTVEGKEKEQLRKKIMKSSVVVYTESKFVESSHKGSDSAPTASEDLAFIEASCRSLDIKRERKLLNDAWFDA